MKKVVKIVFGGLILLLACQQIEARSLTIENMNGWDEQGTVEIKQINVQGKNLFGEETKESERKVGSLLGEGYTAEVVYDKGTWPVTNEAFTLNFQYQKPGASLNYTVDTGDKGIYLRVWPNKFVRVQ